MRKLTCSALSNLDHLTIGIDLGDRYSHYCVLDSTGASAEEGRIQTTIEAFTKRFGNLSRSRIALEAGTHSGWVSRLLENFDHEVLVANTREIRGIGGSDNKNDRIDAEKLARYARVDPSLLSPIQPRSKEAHLDLLVIRIRERLVVARTMLINAARGVVKSMGHRLPCCGAPVFAQHCLFAIPEELRALLTPVLKQIASLTEQIEVYDAQIESLAEIRYPETNSLMSMKGVGALTALSFVLTLGDKRRFARSRDVGCYLGLRPRRSQSGEWDPQLRITKAGNRYLRKTLVQCAHYVLSRGQDSALKRWGLKLAGRGSKNAKKRAVVAVARKLSVILHRLWVTQEFYQSFPHTGPPPERAAVNR